MLRSPQGRRWGCHKETFNMKLTNQLIKSDWNLFRTDEYPVNTPGSIVSLNPAFWSICSSFETSERSQQVEGFTWRRARGLGSLSSLPLLPLPPLSLSPCSPHILSPPSGQTAAIRFLSAWFFSIRRAHFSGVLSVCACVCVFVRSVSVMTPREKTPWWILLRSC